MKNIKGIGTNLVAEIIKIKTLQRIWWLRKLRRWQAGELYLRLLQSYFSLWANSLREGRFRGSLIRLTKWGKTNSNNSNKSGLPFNTQADRVSSTIIWRPIVMEIVICLNNSSHNYNRGIQNKSPQLKIVCRSLSRTKSSRIFRRFLHLSDHKVSIYKKCGRLIRSLSLQSSNSDY
jgi:hypothetical protein